MRGVWRDLLDSVPVAAALGVGDDFAQTHVNPSFLGAPIAPLGWGIAAGEVVLGLAGAVASAVTRRDTWYEVMEPAFAIGTKDLTQALTHTVRAAMAKTAKTLPAPAAPSQVVRLAAAAGGATPARGGRQTSTRF